MNVTLSLACWNGLCDRCDDPDCDCPDDRADPKEPAERVEHGMGCKCDGCDDFYRAVWP